MAYDIENIKRRYDKACAIEDSKDKIVKDLLSHIEALDCEIRKQKDGIDDQTRLLESFKAENKKYKNDIGSICRDQAKLSFVTVLVDGDGMNFHEKFIQGGHNGGHEAARLLIQAAEDHVQKIDLKASPTTRYRILVYANVEGLTKAYQDANVLRADETLTSFIQGFNKEDTMCNFTDAGKGKECTDFKLQAHFEQDILNVHCQRIIFCASADNGYARVLGPHRRSERISLVRGPPFANEMKELAESFVSTSFEEVFMSAKLRTARKVSLCSTNTAITPPRTPTPNYASAAKAAPPPLQTSSTVVTLAMGSTKPGLPICMNARGQRVDLHVQYSSRDNVDKLKGRKLCNQFHLIGSCTYGDGCTHKHGPSLSPREITDLTCIARLSICPNGLFCREVNCTCGHRCPWENCSVYGCRFPESMHGVDTKIVSMI